MIATRPRDSGRQESRGEVAELAPVAVGAEDLVASMPEPTSASAPLPNNVSAPDRAPVAENEQTERTDDIVRAEPAPMPTETENRRPSIASVAVATPTREVESVQPRSERQTPGQSTVEARAVELGAMTAPTAAPALSHLAGLADASQPAVAGVYPTTLAAAPVAEAPTRAEEAETRRESVAEVVPPPLTRPRVSSAAVPDCVGQHAAYRVQDGDTVEGLALRFRVSIQALRRCNQTLSLTLVPGALLGIPVSTEEEAQRVHDMTERGEGLRSPAEREVLRRERLVRRFVRASRCSVEEARTVCEAAGYEEEAVSRMSREEEAVKRMAGRTDLSEAEARLYLEDADFRVEVAMQRWRQDRAFEENARRSGKGRPASAMLPGSSQRGARIAATAPITRRGNGRDAGYVRIATAEGEAAAPAPSPSCFAGFAALLRPRRRGAA